MTVKVNEYNVVDFLDFMESQNFIMRDGQKPTSLIATLIVRGHLFFDVDVSTRTMSIGRNITCQEMSLFEFLIKYTMMAIVEKRKKGNK